MKGRRLTAGFDLQISGKSTALPIAAVIPARAYANVGAAHLALNRPTRGGDCGESNGARAAGTGQNDTAITPRPGPQQPQLAENRPTDPTGAFHRQHAPRESELLPHTCSQSSSSIHATIIGTILRVDAGIPDLFCRRTP